MLPHFKQWAGLERYNVAGTIDRQKHKIWPWQFSPGVKSERRG